MSDVTHLIDAAAAGDARAAEQLLPLVYAELRKLAATRMAAEPAGHTLDATALVHEAYLRLVKSDPMQPWNGRSHFFAAAAEAMRRILIESARRRTAAKRGGGASREPLDAVEVPARDPDEHILAIHEALNELAGIDPDAATLVKLRFFAGMTMEQAADALGVSVRTAYGVWAYARSWLRRRLRSE